MSHSSQELMNNIANVNQIFVPAQIVFIDSQVEDYQMLANGVLSGIETVVLQGDRHGIEQISHILNQKPYSTVHIVSHGSPGCIYLGNSQLGIDTLEKYRQDLNTWFSSPLLPCSPAPLLLLYGCNVAAGDAGDEFITKLHQLTGAEIAASTTRTGNAAKGGNWELDIATGFDRPELAFTANVQQSYAGVFVDIFTDDFDGNTSGGTGNWAVNPNNTDTATTNPNGQWIIAPITEDRFNGDNRIALQLDPDTPANALITGHSTGDDEFTFVNGITTVNSPRFTLANDSDDPRSKISLSLKYYAITNAPSANDKVKIDLVDASNDSVLTSLLDRSFSRSQFPNSWTSLETKIDSSLVGREVYLQFSADNSDGNNVLDFAVDSVSVAYSGLPWEPNSANNGILVRGSALLSCGTLQANGLNSPVLAVDRIDIDADGNPVIPASGEASAPPLSWSHQDWTQEKLGNIYGTAIDGQGNMYAAASANYSSGFFGRPCQS